VADSDVERTASGATAISVEIKGLRKWYGKLEVIRGVDLSVHSGEALVIIGPSGSGKSTLLRCINFLEEYQEGRIYVGGRLMGYRERGERLGRERETEIARARADVGMVFQGLNLFPHMSALDNVCLGLTKVRRLSRQAAEIRAREVLTRVGLADKVDAFPNHLSGGQQQRVAIARAVAMQPKVILFDEVTSALDPELVGEVLGVMRALAKDHGVTMMVVTHEMQFARDVADRVVFMDQGKIVESGDPAEVLDRPRSDRLRTFLRRFRL